MGHVIEYLFQKYSSQLKYQTPNPRRVGESITCYIQCSPQVWIHTLQVGNASALLRSATQPWQFFVFHLVPVFPESLTRFVRRMLRIRTALEAKNFDELLDLAPALMTMHVLQNLPTVNRWTPRWWRRPGQTVELLAFAFDEQVPERDDTTRSSLTVGRPSQQRFNLEGHERPCASMCSSLKCRPCRRLQLAFKF